MNPDMLENMTLADAYDCVLEDLRKAENKIKQLQQRLATVEAERDAYKKKLTYWVNAWLRDLIDWIDEDPIRIEFLKQDIPDTMRKLKQALGVKA